MKKNKPNPQFFPPASAPTVAASKAGPCHGGPGGDSGAAPVPRLPLEPFARRGHATALGSTPRDPQAGPAPPVRLLPTRTPRPPREGGIVPQPCPAAFLPFGVTLTTALGSGQCHLSYAHLGNEGVIAFPTLYLQHLLLRFQTCASAPGVGGDLSVRARLAVCCSSKGKGVLKKICM